MKKIEKKLVYIYENKLNELEKYYVDLFISYLARFILKFLDLLNWISKHKYLTNIVVVTFVLICLYLALTILYYFFMGLNFFLNSIGLNELVEIELKAFKFIWENNPWTQER